MSAACAATWTVGFTLFLFETTLFSRFKIAKHSLATNSLSMNCSDKHIHAHGNEKCTKRQTERYKQLFITFSIPCRIWMDPSVCLRLFPASVISSVFVCV